MNKIYKIIWSKTVGAYVVTSELAKSHTKNPSRKELHRSIAAALMAAMVAAPVSFGVYAAGDTHYVSVKSNNQTADSNYDNDGAQAENSIAIGPSVKTTGKDNIVIGSGEIVSQDKKDGTSFDGTRVLVVGHGNYFQPTSEWDSMKGTRVSYRDSAIIGHGNKLMQGDKNDAGGWSPAYQLVHGWENTLKGSFTGAIGYKNEIKNSSRPNNTSQNMAFTIGTENTIDATGYYMGDKNRVNTLADYKEPGSNPNVVGADLYVIGRHNIIGSTKGADWYVDNGRIIGSENIVYSNDANVFGWLNKVYASYGLAIGDGHRVGVDDKGNLVKNKYGQAIYNPVAVGRDNAVTGDYGVAVGNQAKSRGQKASAVGSTAEALSDYSAALGAENRASGYGSVAVGSLNNKYDFDNPGYKWVDLDSGKYSNAIGVMNISKGESSSAIGTKNISSGSDSNAIGMKNKAQAEIASAMGSYNTASGKRATAVGSYNTATGYGASVLGYWNEGAGKNATSVGVRNNASAEQSSALGYKNTASALSSSALGDENTVSGIGSSGVGYKNTVSGGMASAFGYSNQATAQYGFATGALNQASGRYSSAIGGANQAEGTKSQALGFRNFVNGYGAVSIGSENNLNFVKQYQALGFAHTGDLSSALGISNTTAGRASAGIGNSNYALGTKSVGVGLYNFSTGYESLAMGHYAVAGSEDLEKIDQVKYPVAIGSRAKSTITDAVAIGSLSNTTRDKGDYGYDPSLKRAVTEADITTDENIGTYRTELENARVAWETSVDAADAVLHKIHTQQFTTKEEYQQLETEFNQLNADADAKMAAYAEAQKKVGDLVGAWQGQMAALSVGDENTGRTRQITGVAAGSKDTDAVNVAQLKAIDRKLAQGAVHYYSVTSDKKAAGSNYNNDGAKAADSMVIGIGSTSEGINSTVVGNNNKLTGNKTIKRAGKVVTVNNSIVAGQNLEVDGYSNTVFATESVYDMYQRQTKVAGDHNTVIGAGNLVRYKEEDDGTYTKLGQDFSSNKNVVIGTRHTVSGSNNVVLGYLTEFELGEDEETKQITTADQVTAIGTGNYIRSKAREGVAIGNHLGINGPQTIAIGFGSEANAQSAISIGQSNTAEGKNAISIGNQSHAYAKNSVAIGGPSVTEGPPAEPGALATVENGVALGAGSVADREAGMAGYLAGSKTTAEWKSTLGALSVGVVSDEWTDTRQITGVAAGTKDTDAVNVAQLKKVAAMAASATVDIEAGDNITVTKDANTGKYKISATDTTLEANNNALSLDGSKLNLSVKDKKGTEVTGSVDLKTLQSAVDTNTTYTMKGTENKDNTTTISITDSNGKEQKVTVATKDTNTYTTGGTYDAETKKLKFTQNDPSKNYEVDVSAMINNVVDTNTTYTLEGKEDKKKNTTTIALKGSDGKEQKVTVATKDTRNTIVESDTIAVKGTTQKDGSTEYKLNVKANGKVEKGNKGIVTGGTVYKETRIEKDGNYIKKNNTAGENLIALDKQVGINTGNIHKNTETINILGKQVGNLDTKVNRVGAGAAALAGLHPLDYDPDNKFDFAAGYGNYKGAHALAIGAFYRPDENKMISIGGSFGGGENMVSAGVSVKLGQGTGISTSKVAMAKEISELKEENREMKQEIEVLKEQMQKLLAGK